MKKSYEILVCRGPECGDRRHAGDVYAQFREVVTGCGLTDQVSVARQSCFGRCRRGPNVLVREVEPGAPRRRPTRFAFAAMLSRAGAATLYNHVTPGDAERIVQEHVVGGKVIEDLIEPPRRARPRPAANPAVSEKTAPSRAAPNRPDDGEPHGE